MTTYYTLPEWLGTREVVIVPRPEGGTLHIGGELAELVAIPHTECRLVIARSELTEVKPPLPPEPPMGTVFSNEGDAWIRCDDPEMDPRGRWWLTGSDVYDRWADHVAPLVSEPGWRRYVPDPADDAPELPWHLDDVRIGRASVFKPRNMDDGPDGMTHAHVWKGDYTAGECRRIAAAFWRAAREVEKP